MREPSIFILHWALPVHKGYKGADHLKCWHGRNSLPSLTPKGRGSPSSGTVKQGLRYERECSCYSEGSVGIWNVTLKGPVSVLLWINNLGSSAWILWALKAFLPSSYHREGPSPMPSTNLYPGSSPGKFPIVYASKSMYYTWTWTSLYTSQTQWERGGSQPSPWSAQRLFRICGQ